MSAYVPPGEARVAEIVRAVKTVAVVGMKDERTPVLPAFFVPQVMQAHGIRVLPVNPGVESSLGEKAVARLAELTVKPDLVQVFRRSEAVLGVADEVLALPASCRPAIVWTQLGIVNQEAAEKLTAAGIEVVMDRCFKVELAKYGR